MVPENLVEQSNHEPLDTSATIHHSPQQWQNKLSSTVIRLGDSSHLKDLSIVIRPGDSSHLKDLSIELLVTFVFMVRSVHLSPAHLSD